MFKRINVVLTSFILIAMLLAPIAPVQAKLELDEGPVNLLDAKGNSIRFEVRVPIDELLIETVELDGENYSQISLQGFDQISQQAAPQLPMLTEVFGAPFDNEVAITVVPGRAQRIALSVPVSPVMTESVDFSEEQLLSGDFSGVASVFSYLKDPEIYDRMASYPNVFAEITNDGQMIWRSALILAVLRVLSKMNRSLKRMLSKASFKTICSIISKRKPGARFRQLKFKQMVNCGCRRCPVIE